MLAAMTFWQKNKKLVIYPALTIVFAAFVLLVIAGRAKYSPFNYTLF